jgi:hypothetical protein
MPARGPTRDGPPVETVERLIDIAAGARGVNDAPTLTLFADVRMLIEQANRLGSATSTRETGMPGIACVTRRNVHEYQVNTEPLGLVQKGLTGLSLWSRRAQ